MLLHCLALELNHDFQHLKCEVNQYQHGNPIYQTMEIRKVKKIILSVGSVCVMRVLRSTKASMTMASTALSTKIRKYAVMYTLNGCVSRFRPILRTTRMTTVRKIRKIVRLTQKMITSSR